MNEPDNDTVRLVIAEYERLADETRDWKVGSPAAFVYRPLDYARTAHQAYLRRYLPARPRCIFLGMNPGPFGMAQTGIPFGEVATVRDWLGIHDGVFPPGETHPKKPVLGFACRRSEVSGRRLWGLFRQRFASPEAFFAGHFVINYCPLLFLDVNGANLTPVQLAAADQHRLNAVCDASLRRLMIALQPEWVIGVGKFAADRAVRALDGLDIRVASILHPSPANPQANRDWAGCAARTLIELAVWPAAAFAEKA